MNDKRAEHPDVPNTYHIRFDMTEFHGELRVHIHIESESAGTLKFESRDLWRTVAHSFWLNSNAADGRDDELGWDAWFDDMMKEKRGWLYLNTPENLT